MEDFLYQMAFLTDIFGKRNKKLNFRKKSIGFQEDRKALCVIVCKGKNLQKSDFKTVVEKENILNLDLRPPLLSLQKMTDIVKPHKLNGFEAVYRFFHISPQKHAIKREVYRFTAIAVTAVFVLNLVGAYNAGMTLKKNLEAKASGAYESLKMVSDSAKNQDFLMMFAGFSKLNQILTEAEKSLEENLHLQTDAGSDLPLQNIALLLRAGKHLSRAGEHLSKTIYGAQQLPHDFMRQNNEKTEKLQPVLKITDKIKEDSDYLSLAMTEITNAEEILNIIQPKYLPLEFQNKIGELRTQLVQAQKIISLVQSYVPYVLDLLGDRYPQRYMILLQNNHELRATGGFIGSYILLDINDGLITKFEFKDVYEADGQFHEKVTPPQGLHKITDDWRMRDANYSPDFATSARQVMWFLEHEKGPTVDTVISLNQRVVENLLAKIGSVELPGEKIAIDAENFSWIFSYLIEAKLSDSNTPKQFLMDFVPVFKERLLQPENLPALLEVLLDSVERKDVMAYSTDAEISGLVEQFGLGGKMPFLDETFDYLQVVNTSIGGNKSDGFITQKIQHNTKIVQGGGLVNDLTLTRRHTWYHAEDEIFDKLFRQYGAGKLERQELKDILGFGGNKSLIRVYVPLGSQLLSATGGVATENILVYEDLGKTVFAFEQTAIYTEREFTQNIKYKLPHRLDLKYADNYKMLVQNQPGQEENYFSKTVTLQGDGKILDQYPQAVFLENDQRVSFDKFLTGDEYLSVVVGEK